jgi:acetate kinase
MNPSDPAFLKSSVLLLADFGEGRPKQLIESSRTVALTPGECLVHGGQDVHSLGVFLEGPAQRRARFIGRIQHED